MIKMHFIYMYQYPKMNKNFNVNTLAMLSAREPGSHLPPSGHCSDKVGYING